MCGLVADPFDILEPRPGREGSSLLSELSSEELSELTAADLPFAGLAPSPGRAVFSSLESVSELSSELDESESSESSAEDEDSSLDEESSDELDDLASLVLDRSFLFAEAFRSICILSFSSDSSESSDELDDEESSALAGVVAFSFRLALSLSEDSSEELDDEDSSVSAGVVVFPSKLALSLSEDSSDELDDEDDESSVLA